MLNDQASGLGGMVVDAAVTRLRKQGFLVHNEDVARLSPFIHGHVNMLGRYSFALPDLPGGLRPLGEPDDTHPGEDIVN